MKPLTVAAWFSLVALGVALVGIAFDHTSITGSPAWLKPAKFGISIAVYCATLAWMLSHVTGHDILVRSVSWATAIGLVAELVLIDFQVIRGTTSHFNLSTPFDAAITATMGGLVVVIFTAALVAAGLLLTQHGLPVWISYGLRGGLLVVILGMAEAVLMLANTNGPAGGGHTVGAPDGGPGLPVLGWSTQHGDLRVAHFVGLHGLQVIPGIAWALHRFLPDAGDSTQKRLIMLATIGYAGLVVLSLGRQNGATPCSASAPPKGDRPRLRRSPDRPLASSRRCPIPSDGSEVVGRHVRERGGDRSADSPGQRAAGGRLGLLVM